jgi:hypothetical protein
MDILPIVFELLVYERNEGITKREILRRLGDINNFSPPS